MIDLLLKNDKLTSLKIIKNIFLIGGIYDLTEIPFTIHNKNNVLSLTEENITTLSPVMLDYTKWTDLNLDIVLFSAEYDSPTFKKQTIQMKSIWEQKYQLKCRYYLLPGCDHFDLVERILDPKFAVTQEVLGSI